MKNPLRRQLLLPLLAVLGGAVAGTAGVSAWVNSSRQVALLEARRDEVARVLEEAPFPLSAAVLGQIARLSGQEFVAWNPSQRRIELTSLESVTTELSSQIEAWAAGKAPLEQFTLVGERYDVRAISLRGQPGLRLLVLTPRRSLTEARWSAAWPPLAVGAAALLVLTPWLLALTGSWSRRVAVIQQAVARIAHGEKETETIATIPVGASSRDDELAALIADIRVMSRRLAALQSELVQTERERLAAQLAAGFAHQFRNGVAGASLALELHAGRCSSRSDKSLTVARRQLALLEAETRGMLSLAKRSESPRESLSLASLVDEAIELVEPMIEHHAIVFTREFDSREAFVLGSRDGLRAALLNLLQNAIEAAGPSGSVRVAQRAGETSATFLVADNGGGPAPQIAERITEAFITTKPEGIGLGLTVVATVASDHGGRLSWKRENGWTEFQLSLPLDSSRSFSETKPESVS